MRLKTLQDFLKKEIDLFLLNYQTSVSWIAEWIDSPNSKISILEVTGLTNGFHRYLWNTRYLEVGYRPNKIASHTVAHSTSIKYSG